MFEEDKKELIDIQNEFEVCGFSEDLLELELLAHGKLSSHLSSRRKLTADSTQVKWLKHGDMNSKFFHGTLFRRSAQKPLSQLLINEMLTSNTTEIENYILGFYSDLFSSAITPKDLYIVKKVILQLVTVEENMHLTAIPTDLNIKNLAFSFNLYSAPGPDGFSGLF